MKLDKILAFDFCFFYSVPYLGRLPGLVKLPSDPDLLSYLPFSCRLSIEPRSLVDPARLSLSLTMIVFCSFRDFFIVPPTVLEAALIPMAWMALVFCSLVGINYILFTVTLPID